MVWILHQSHLVPSLCALLYPYNMTAWFHAQFNDATAPHVLWANG